MNKEEIDNEHLESLEIFMKHHYIADNEHYKWIKKRFKELQAKLNQLETNRDEAIEYIKHSWRLKFDQVYDTSKNLSGWEAEELLSILERGKE